MRNDPKRNNKKPKSTQPARPLYRPDNDKDDDDCRPIPKSPTRMKKRHYPPSSNPTSTAIASANNNNNNTTTTAFLDYDRLVVFRANPLAYRHPSTKQLHPMETLNDALEEEALSEGLSEAHESSGSLLDVTWETATLDRFDAVLARGDCRVLHWSCHGQESFLALENTCGGVQMLTVPALKRLVQAAHCNKKLLLVVVSACHSEAAARAFLQAGVPHVVCCKREVQDEGAIRFAKSFYRALALRNPLQRAFDLAVEAVRNAPNVAEDDADKFLLLPQRKDDYHNVPVFFTTTADDLSAPPSPNGMIVGDRRSRVSFTSSISCAFPSSAPWRRVTPWRMLPRPPQCFVGRRVDMYRILSALHVADVVRVEGPVGVGKYSLVAAVCDYMNQRPKVFTFDHMLWLSSPSSSSSAAGSTSNRPPSPPPEDDDTVAMDLYKAWFEIMLTWKQGTDERSSWSSSLVAALHQQSLFLVLDARAIDTSSMWKRLELFLNILFQVVGSKRCKVVLIVHTKHHTNGDCEAHRMLHFGRKQDVVHIGPLSPQMSALLFATLSRHVWKTNWPGAPTPQQFAEILFPPLSFQDSVPCVYGNNTQQQQQEPAPLPLASTSSRDLTKQSQSFGYHWIVRRRRAKLFASLGKGFPSLVCEAATEMSKTQVDGLLRMAMRRNIFDSSDGGTVTADYLDVRTLEETIAQWSYQIQQYYSDDDSSPQVQEWLAHIEELEELRLELLNRQQHTCNDRVPQTNGGRNGSTLHSSSPTSLKPTSSWTLPTIKHGVLKQKLQEQGFSSGLVAELENAKIQSPVRFWIVDNSDHMNKKDGHVMVRSTISTAECANNQCRIRHGTRWEELQGTVCDHARLAALTQTPTIFRLLNDPAVEDLPQQFSVAGKGPECAQEEICMAHTVMKSSKVYGGCSLTDHLRFVHNKICAAQEELRSHGQHAVVVIATNGVPSSPDRPSFNGSLKGSSPDAVLEEDWKHDLEVTLKLFQPLPVWIVILLCSDDESVVDYYNKLDHRLELPLEVLDDYVSEAKQVCEKNKWLNYALPLHRCREIGSYHRVLDHLDERNLSTGELQQLLIILFGNDPWQNAPDMQTDWYGFEDVLSRVLEKEGLQWNPISEKAEPWVDLLALRQAFAPAQAKLTFPRAKSVAAAPAAPIAVQPKELMIPALAAQSSAVLEESQRIKLQEQGFPAGLIHVLHETKMQYPIRFWIADNSGSMSYQDGIRFVTKRRRKSNHVEAVRCTRWKELQTTVQYHAKLAGLLQASTSFRLLNHPGIRSGCQEFSVAQRGVSFIEEDVRLACSAIEMAEPMGVTPLNEHIKVIRDRIKSIAPQLKKNGQKALVVIATDGVASDKDGETTPESIEEFKRLLKSLQALPAWVVVRLCSDDTEMVEIYDELDKQLELPLEVLDDFLGEAQQIHKMNSWLTYALPLHRCREMGSRRRVLDRLDESKLTRDELYDLLVILFGNEPFKDAPDIQEDWEGFLDILSDVVEREGKQWNTIEDDFRFWVDLDALRSEFSEDDDEFRQEQCQDKNDGWSLHAERAPSPQLPPGRPLAVGTAQEVSLALSAFPSGLVEILQECNAYYPLRFWIVDNGGSMGMPGGHRIVDAPSNGAVEAVPSTRWEELQESLLYHMRMCGELKTEGVIRFANDPGPQCGPQVCSVLRRGAQFIHEDVSFACSVVQKTRPSGVSLLTNQVKAVHDRIKGVEDSLRRNGQQVVVVIATDGLPTDELGESTKAAKQDFERALWSIAKLPVWIVIRLCSDTASVVSYYNKLDSKPDLPLEVLDDFFSESEKVYKMNRWLNYALPLHRFREMGSSHRSLDMLNEKRLHKDELKELLTILFGSCALQGAPNIHKDWKGFLNFVSEVVDNAGTQWNPATGEIAPWIDIERLKKDFSGSFFNRLRRKSSRK